MPFRRCSKTRASRRSSTGRTSPSLRRRAGLRSILAVLALSSIPSVVPFAPAEAQPVAAACPGPRSLADLVGQATNVWVATVEAADPTAGAGQGNWTLVVLVQGILKGPVVSGRTPAVVFSDLHGSPMPLDQVDRIRSFLLRKQDL